VNEELAAQHAVPIAACLGQAARLIGLSKTGYREQHSDHVVVFNANVCFDAGKVWWGDLDLTLEESKLVRLAAETGETVHLLYEWDGRFANEDAPLLAQAVYSVTPSGHTRVDHTSVERRADGMVYARLPVRQPRFRRPGRLRLWRFWLLERHIERSRDALGDHRSALLYVGRRGAGASGSPLLVLGLHSWSHHVHDAMLEYTWYPAGGQRWAPRVALRLKWRHGRVRPFIALRIVPGLCTELRVGIALGPKDTLWG
jgi:hypothetical protein